MIDRSRRVILLIDYDNLQICAARDTPGRELQLTPVVQLAQRYGTVILARAYAEWNLSTERLSVYKAGIEPAFAPVLRTESDRSGKSLADTVMVAEGMDMLWTLSPEVMVLATSDKDLIPLVRVAKQRGAHVVVLGSDFTAIPLREMADDHVTYKQLITDATGRYAEAARAPTATPEPAPAATGLRSRRTRRERESREGRESRAAGAASAAGTGAPSAAGGPSGVSGAGAGAGQAGPAAAQPQPAAAGAEPVPPVGSPGEADGQVGGRRRRRRGSRRRGERLGVTGDVGPGANGETSGGPNGEAPGVEVAQSSSGSVEAGAESAAAAARAAATDEPAEPPEALIADVPPPGAPLPEPEAGPPPDTDEAPAAAPSRRSRARRVASASPSRTRARRKA
jgi:uncharacterized LabA/DUF88 family protein